jgi:hypothetical protein
MIYDALRTIFIGICGDDFLRLIRLFVRNRIIRPSVGSIRAGRLRSKLISVRRLGLGVTHVVYRIVVIRGSRLHPIADGFSFQLVVRRFT